MKLSIAQCIAVGCYVIFVFISMERAAYVMQTLVWISSDNPVTSLLGGFFMEGARRNASHTPGSTYSSVRLKSPTYVFVFF